MDDASIGQTARQHRFFKGCTRPAMLAGVPLMPFLLVTGVTLLLGMWAFYLVSPYATLSLALAYVPTLIGMRQATKKDDQRLKQILLRARLRYRHGNKAMWGAISFSPLRYKKRPL